MDGTQGEAYVQASLDLPVLTQATRSDKSNTSLTSFVFELREDIVPLLLVLLPNLCLLLTELHRLTRTCRLGIGFL